MIMKLSRKALRLTGLTYWVVAGPIGVRKVFSELDTTGGLGGIRPGVYGAVSVPDSVPDNSRGLSDALHTRIQEKYSSR